MVASLAEAREKARLAALIQFDNSIRNALGDTMVAEYTFNNGSLVDSTGLGHNGTLIDNAAVVDDEDLNSDVLQLNGNNEYLRAVESPKLRLTDDITISFFMLKNSEQSNWVRLVGKGSKSNMNYGVWEGSGADKRILFQQRYSDNNYHINFSSITEIEIGRWYHVVATIKDQVAKIYIDGKLDATSSPSIPVGVVPRTSSESLTIGYGTYHNYFDGKIDNVRIYAGGL